VAEPSIAFRGRFLDVIWENGAEYTHNRRARGVVLIIPVTGRGEMIFIEQYRLPLKCNVIEFPAGLVGDEDDANESFEVAARRELLEESGCVATELEFLFRGPASPGSSTEVVSFYLATDAQNVRQACGVAHERIEKHCIKLEHAQQWLAEKVRAGALVDPRVYLGVYLANERRAAIG
jgi:ADP-ribose pyrophosphatase